MKISDLRVGNTLLFQGSKGNLFGINKDFIVQYSQENDVFNCGKDEIEPIPLQPDHAKTYELLKVIQVNDDFFASFGRLKIQIKYYHELQNFHYLINGYEL